MTNSPLKYWQLAAVVAIAVLSSTLASASLSQQPVKRLTDEEKNDIREAVFRYQFHNNASGLQQLANSYFISIEAGDPDDKFMERFKDHDPPVKKSSRVKGEWGVKENGRGSLMFRIDGIKQISADEVEVAGGYFEDGLSASGNIYTVQRIKDKWTVTKDKMQWIA